MKNRQFIKLLKTFTPKEIKNFSEFISSPFFNRNKNVVKLYEIIKKTHPDFEQEDLNKENLFNSVYPGKKFNDNTLRFLLHLLYECAKKFLVYNRIEKDVYRYKEELASEFLERELYIESVKESDKAISELEKSDLKDSDYYQYKFEFGVLNLNCIQKIKIGKYETYISESNITLPFKNLTYFYISKLLTYYSLVLNDKEIYNIDIDTSFYEQLFPYFNYELFNDSPLIQIYYNIVMLHKTNDEKYFYTIKNLIQKHEKSIIPARLNYAYTTIENFCHRKIMTGEKHFRQELFEIQKLILNKQIYKTEPFMRLHFYKNVSQTAVKLKEFDWADNFIESYKNELRPDYREAVYNYCKAYLEAEKNNYEKSLKHLSKLRTDEVFLKIDLKLLQARLYYELDWYDVLNSAIDSIKHFLKSNKFIAKNRRTRFLTLIKFMSALNNAQLKKDEIKIHELKEKIIKTKDLQWQDWFIKKVEELEANS